MTDSRFSPRTRPNEGEAGLTPSHPNTDEANLGELPPVATGASPRVAPVDPALAEPIKPKRVLSTVPPVNDEASTSPAPVVHSVSTKPARPAEPFETVDPVETETRSTRKITSAEARRDFIQRTREAARSAQHTARTLKDKAKAKASGTNHRSQVEDRPSIGELVGLLSKQMRTLIKGELTLAKSKAAMAGKQFGVAIGMLVVAGVLALYMLERFLRAAEYGLATVLPMWAACLIVGAVLLLIILILLLVAKSSVDKGKKQVPTPQKGVEKDISAVKKGLNK